MIQIRSISRESLQALAAEGTLYAIADACDCPAVPEKSAELGETNAFCLYTGEAREKTAAAAPYLFHATPPILEWIADSLPSDTWGIFLASRQPMTTIGSHLERLLIVQLPDRKKRSFRFYDPRILPVFLESCTKDQIRTFFGPIRAFAVSTPEGADFHTQDPALASVASNNYFTPDGHFPIFEPQINRFQQTIDQNLRTALAAHLKEKHPQAVEQWPPEILEQRAAVAIQKARAYEINDQQSLKTFLSVMVEFGPNFHAHPPIHAMLADTNIPADLRVRAAITRVPPAEWKAARNNRNDAAWEIR